MIYEREGSENRVIGVEHVERFASKASKRGKILTIDSPKACLMLQSFFVGLTVTASLGNPTVARVSYVW